ncbi:hypothetical protein [Litorihabitans aurantiacus]|uniref:Uncharacterized protein n=1 Tax=Litorihabitans aurantiacus TaxID=1930061 RepID=A0AA37UGU2_9MICO|nr:hypothetical protein [Litorihabitans aurantiacus]GMA30189.1 hypothetical protein GCM10025875_01810 [Litorihabitans aurantiacus]
MGHVPPDEFGAPTPDDDAADHAVGNPLPPRHGPGGRTVAVERAGFAVLGDDAPDPAGEGDAPGPTRRGPRTRSRRRTRVIATAGALVVLAAATGGLLWTQERERRTPEAAVAEYVGLVERGEVEAATALVPVPGTPLADADADDTPTPTGPTTGSTPITVTVDAPAQVLDPALLTDAVYAAGGGIADVEVVSLERAGTPPVGGVVEVEVSYLVSDVPSTAVLRVERRPDSFPGLPSYRVLDSLARPAVVDIFDTDLGTASIDGVPVLTSGSPGVGAPQLATMLYPGLYEVAFDGGSHLSASPADLRVGSGRTSERDAVVRVDLQVTPTQTAQDAATEAANAFLAACADRTVPPSPSCPAPYLQAPGEPEPIGFTSGFTGIALALALEPDGEGTAPVVQASLQVTVVVRTEQGARDESFWLTVLVPLDDSLDPVVTTRTPYG